MLERLNALYPIRYTALALCVFFALLSLFALLAFGVGLVWLLLFGGLSVLGWRDLRQSKSSVLRNYPVIGHLRYMLETVRPELITVEALKERSCPFRCHQTAAKRARR